MTVIDVCDVINSIVTFFLKLLKKVRVIFFFKTSLLLSNHIDVDQQNVLSWHTLATMYHSFMDLCFSPV